MLRVGTSGWQYRSWRGRFYPKQVAAARWLEHFAARFATVEVNNTFYRLPPRETFESWHARVPDDFTIAVKASRYLTHYKRLHEPADPVERLLDHAAGLGTSLGPVLLQLPPDLPVAVDRLDETLQAFGGRTRLAVEFRHASWFIDEVREVLAARGAAMVLADRDARPLTPMWRTADWCYVRFHAGTASPRPCYGRRALDSWTRRIRELWPDGDGYVYFNNDPEGCAVRDAIVFAHLAASSGTVVTRVPDLSEARVGQIGTSRTTSAGGLSVR
ncbi:MAG: DUF72 domain-containing protein [Acidimicrobiia bacterium]